MKKFCGFYLTIYSLLASDNLGLHKTTCIDPIVTILRLYVVECDIEIVPSGNLENIICKLKTPVSHIEFHWLRNVLYLERLVTDIEDYLWGVDNYYGYLA